MRPIPILSMLIAVAFASAAVADETPPPKGNFMSSLKQSFRQDYDHEVVRGHFDIGAAPNSHRYYCLVDPKNGKTEANGLSGTLKPRRDGMTGIQDVAVSFYSCSDAESKGLLVTSDYHVVTEARPRPVQAASTASAEERSARLSTSDPMSTLQSFIEVYNSGDGSVLGSVLGESADFAWVQADGRTVWGHKAASDALQLAKAAGAQLQFQSQEGHTILAAAKTAILITKLRLAQTGQEARTIRCSGVIVQTPKGWRLASLFMTPEVS